MNQFRLLLTAINSETLTKTELVLASIVAAGSVACDTTLHKTLWWDM